MKKIICFVLIFDCFNFFKENNCGNKKNRYSDKTNITLNVISFFSPFGINYLANLYPNLFGPINQFLTVETGSICVTSYFLNSITEKSIQNYDRELLVLKNTNVIEYRKHKDLENILQNKNFDREQYPDKEMLYKVEDYIKNKKLLQLQYNTFQKDSFLYFLGDLTYKLLFNRSK